MRALLILIVITCVQTHQGAALRLGVDMKLFSAAVAANGAITIDQLAKEVEADRDLVCKLISSSSGYVAYLGD